MQTDKLNIYVASSWRNTIQPEVVRILRECGHEVYDFRHPEPGNEGFAWTEIDPDWQQWSPEQYKQALQHPIAQHGYKLDKDAINRCDVCLLVLPSGRSASWELGNAMGQGKTGVVFQLETDKIEPELMYREATILIGWFDLWDAFRRDR